MFGCCGVGRRQRYYYSLFVRKDLNLRADRLFEKQWQASDVWLAFRHSLCDKSVIGEPPNLTHNLPLKRAAIGQLTGDIGSDSDKCLYKLATPYARHRLTGEEIPIRRGRLMLLAASIAFLALAIAICCYSREGLGTLWLRTRTKRFPRLIAGR